MPFPLQLICDPRCRICDSQLEDSVPCDCLARDPAGNESLFPDVPEEVECARCGCTRYDLVSERLLLDRPNAVCCGTAGGGSF